MKLALREGQPHGSSREFDKRTADKDVAVHGDAETDVDFSGGGDEIRYSVAVGTRRVHSGWKSSCGTSRSAVVGR